MFTKAAVNDNSYEHYLEIILIGHSFQKDTILHVFKTASVIIHLYFTWFIKWFSGLILAEQRKWNRNVIIYLCYRFGHASVFLENLMPAKIIHPDAYANSCGCLTVLKGPICHSTV